MDKQTYIRALGRNSISAAITGPLFVQRFLPLKATPMSGPLGAEELRNSLSKMRLLGTSSWATARFVNYQQEFSHLVVEPEPILEQPKTVKNPDLANLSMLQEFLGDADSKLHRFEEPRVKDNQEKDKKKEADNPDKKKSQDKPQEAENPDKKKVEKKFYRKLIGDLCASWIQLNPH